MDAFVNFFASVAGFVPVVAFGATLIAFIVDTAKRLGLPDGYAPALSGGLNLALYALLYFAGDAHRAQIQDAVAAIYAVTPYVVALLMSALGAVGVHQQLTKIGLGYSHGLG
jgi:hypothetical protein